MAVLLSSTILMSPLAVHAQQGPVVLEDITIDGQRVATGAEATINNAREVVNRTPGAVSVVTAEDTKGVTVTTLKDVLDYVPGVFIQPKAGEDARLSIRGSGLSRNFHLRGVRLLVDGIPLNTADGAGDFQEIDPLSILYTEVYRGGNALRWGSSYLGGAIYIASPTGRDVSSPYFGRVEVGSDGYFRAHAGTGGVVGNWDYYLSTSYQKSDGWRQQNEQTNRRLSANVGYRFNDQVETRFYINLNDLDLQLPGNLTRFQALTTPKLTTPANLANNYQRNIESTRIANKTTIKLDNTQIDFGGYIAGKHLYHPIFQVIDYNNLDYGAFGSLTNEHLLWGNKGRLIVGTNIGGGTTAVKQFVNVGGNRGLPTAFGTQYALNLEAFAEYQYFFLPKIALVTGLQAAYAEREQQGRFGVTNGAKNFEDLNPKVGLLYEVDKNTQVFANVTKSFEAPPFSEVGPNFAPANPVAISAQKAWTVEVGTRGRYDDIRWDVALYRSMLKDEFQFEDLGGGVSQVRNADKTVHQGLELGFGFNVLKYVGKVDPTHKLWLNAAYTYSDFHFDGDRLYGDNKIPGAPEHFIRAELMYKNQGGFYIGPNLEWVPQGYFVDNANTANLKTKSYALLGFKAGYDWSNGLSVFVDARNLTDEKYISSTSVTGTANINSALYTPGNGRTIYGGISKKF